MNPCVIPALQPPSFPHSFFVIPAKAGTHGPDYPNNSLTLSRPNTPSFPRPSASSEPTARSGSKSPTVSRSTTPVIPAPLSSSGNPRPGLSQQLSHPQQTNTPVIPAP